MATPPFNILLEQAAALKTSQLAQDRTKFDSWDSWYQNSLFSKEDICIARNTFGSDNLLAFAQECKDKANSFYTENDINLAVNEYERCLALFEWLEPTEKDWKTKGIQDSKIKEMKYYAKSEDESNRIYQIRIACFLNLSMCYLKEKQWLQCIKACDKVLAMEPSNAKALYRRAQARILPASCGVVENQMALDDLRKACLAKPGDALLTTAYAELKIALKKQKLADKKTFSGLFDRNDTEGGDSMGDGMHLCDIDGEVGGKCSNAVLKAEHDESNQRQSTSSSSSIANSNRSSKSGSTNSSNSNLVASSSSSGSYSNNPSSSSSRNERDNVDIAAASTDYQATDSIYSSSGLTWHDAIVLLKDMETSAKNYEDAGEDLKAQSIRRKISDLQVQMDQYQYNPLPHHSAKNSNILASAPVRNKYSGSSSITNMLRSITDSSSSNDASDSVQPMSSSSQPLVATASVAADTTTPTTGIQAKRKKSHRKKSQSKASSNITAGDGDSSSSGSSSSSSSGDNNTSKVIVSNNNSNINIKTSLTAAAMLSNNTDFYHPTAEMIEDAKSKGLDLTDKRVQKLLHELNKAHIEFDQHTEHVLSDSSNNKKLTTNNSSGPSSDNSINAGAAALSTQRLQLYLKAAMRNIHLEEAEHVTNILLQDLSDTIIKNMLIYRMKYQLQVSEKMHDKHSQNDKSELPLYQVDDGNMIVSVEEAQQQLKDARNNDNKANVLAQLRMVLIEDIVKLRTAFEREFGDDYYGNNKSKTQQQSTARGDNKTTASDSGNDETNSAEYNLSEQIVNMLELCYGTSTAEGGNGAIYASAGGGAAVKMNESYVNAVINSVIRWLALLMIIVICAGCAAMVAIHYTNTADYYREHHRQASAKRPIPEMPYMEF